MGNLFVKYIKLDHYNQIFMSICHIVDYKSIVMKRKKFYLPPIPPSLPPSLPALVQNMPKWVPP